MVLLLNTIAHMYHASNGNLLLQERIRVAGYFGCCANITEGGYHNIVIIILVVSFALFGICMYNNCCKIPKENGEAKE